MVSISGLGSGLDTQAIIAQLMQLEQRKVDVVSARSLNQTDALSSWTTIRSTLTTFNTAANALAQSTNWQPLAATTSDDTVAGVSAGSGTMTGSLTFSVDSLAQAGVVRSAKTINSLSARVTSDASLLIAGGAGKLGFGSVASNDSVTLGAHTIVVTQASSAAMKSGNGALAASTVIDNSNNALQIEVNGATRNLTLASGTYDAQQLAMAVQTAANNAGAQIATSTAADGSLRFSTLTEGMSATLRVTGGTALTALNVTTDGPVITGTNGQLTVDGGPTQTFGASSPLGTGQSIAINAGAGTITAALSGGLRLGSITATNVSTGDGSLQSVVSAINGAKAGVSAAAIQVGTNAFRLQIGSSTTGANNDPNIAGSEFDSAAIGGLTVLSQGTDAQITIGSGAGAYSIASSTNSMTNVLPGVSVTLKKQSANPVTVSVSRDVEGLAAKVQALVDAANASKKEIDRATFYDPATRKGAPLVGDGTASRLQSSLYAAMTAAVPGANPTTPGLLGVSSDAKGNFTFDKTKFTTAFANDPDGVAKVFGQFGTSTNGSLSFANATAKTAPGTYAIDITSAAAQAGSTSSGVPTVGTTVRAKIGSSIAAYTVQSGDGAAEITTGLNASFAAQNLGLVATVQGGNVDIRTGSYGSRSAVDIAWDGVTYATHTGADVAGTINGIAATGTGQTLSTPNTDPTLAGLSVQVVGTATGALGSITYSPGSAARAQRAITLATDSINGYITTTETGIKSTKKLIDDQVDRMNQRLVDYHTRLKRQYAALETAMSNLNSRSSWLSGQLARL